MAGIKKIFSPLTSLYILQSIQTTLFNFNSRLLYMILSCCSYYMVVYLFHRFICLNALSKNQRFPVSAWRYFGVVPILSLLATQRGSRWTWSGWRVVWFEKTAKCVTYAFRSVNPFLNSYNSYRLLRILYPEFETHVPMYRYAQKNWHK